MSTRRGFVLLLALLAILALELTVAALHIAALQQLRAARAGTRGLQLRLSAQSAVAAALASWPGGEALAVAPGERLPLPTAGGAAPQGITFGAYAERLDSSLFLVRAEARSPLRERAAAGYLLVVGEPRVKLPAALQGHADVRLEGGALVASAAPACAVSGEPHLALRVAATERLLLAGDALLSGPVTAAPELAGADLDAALPSGLRGIADEAQTLAGATVSPAPVHDGGRCATGSPGNWGEPLPAVEGDPCAGWFPVLHRAGDLAIEGGRGQGVLQVAGNLELGANATFHGLVLVAGNLTVADGAAIEGAVVVAGEVVVRNGSVTGNACALQRALRAVPALSGPFRPGSRSWIPLF